MEIVFMIFGFVELVLLGLYLIVHETAILVTMAILILVLMAGLPPYEKSPKK